MATAAIVSFGLARGVISAHAPGPGAMRSAQFFSVLPALTTDQAVDGEVAIVANPGATMLTVAVGSNPDALTTLATATSGAGFGLGSFEVRLIPVRTGDKVSIKALP